MNMLINQPCSVRLIGDATITFKGFEIEYKYVDILDSDIRYVEGEKQRVRMLSQSPRYIDIQIKYIPLNLCDKPPEYHREKIMLHKIGFCSGFPSNT